MTTLLLITAALLGTLAFFEPCTIATHTLFSARSHHQSRKACCQGLLGVWLTRSVLVILLLVMATVIMPAPHWGPYLPSMVLSAMGVLYLVSRFVYIPVPHLEFYRLLPDGKNLPFAMQLGLTLPACTIPLFVVIVGMTITVGSIAVAAIAGFLFATLFTAPMVITSFKGVHADGRELLNHAAKGSPYLTAVLLFGSALYLLVPALELSTETLTLSLQQASIGGVGLAFLAGLVFSFNPVSFASIPVVLAYVTKAHEERRALLMGVAFVLGMLVTHVVLGVAAATGGEWVQSAMGRYWGLLLAFALGRSIPVMLGAWSMGWLDSLHMLSRHQKALEIIAGITLIITGLYLLNEYFFIIKY